MSDLVVIAFKDKAGGPMALQELDRLQKQELIQLEDAAVVTRNEKGKLKVSQTLEKQVTGSAAVWGGFWGLLIGLFFPFTLLWGLFGALLGAIFGRRTDVGIDNKFIKEVGSELENGDSAIFMLVIKWTEDRVVPELAKLGGTLYQTSFDKEHEEKFRKALEHEDLHAAAHENLELD